LLGEAAVELFKGGLVVLCVDYLAGLVGTLRPWSDDAFGADAAALGNGGGRDAAGFAISGGDGGNGRFLGGGDVDNVEFATGGGLDSVVFGGVVRDVVAVNDVLGLL